MSPQRRDFLRLLAAAIGTHVVPAAADSALGRNGASAGFGLDVRAFGAAGDGKTIDTPAVNKAIAEAASKGGGIVHFPAGTYACHSIRLQSFVALHLDPGAVILAAGTPHEGTVSGGYDPAESNAPWEQFQDFGHNHWHNSLIWGEGIHDVAILGTGADLGKGLSRGDSDADLPIDERPGAATKRSHSRIATTSFCATFRFSAPAISVSWPRAWTTSPSPISRIDTNRDGMNIDCCQNVRISGCSVNSPWDDAICLKSSFALGTPVRPRMSTIADCYVTGGYQVGAMLDGTSGAGVDAAERRQTDRANQIGTESNGGFKNITITNCVFESSRGLALECVDGGALEDISIVGITMRDVRTHPSSCGSARGCAGRRRRRSASIKRVMISNVMCDGPSRHALDHRRHSRPSDRGREISDVSIEQKGQGTAGMAAIEPPERVETYPEPVMFGTLPAQGFFIRHARNVEFGNVQIVTAAPDARPVFWLDDVDGADFFRIDLSRRGSTAAFQMNAVRAFRVFGSRGVPDTSLPIVTRQKI